MNNQQHLQSLNEQQREAVLCPEDIVFVNAGPGTGKTHMLTGKLIDVIISSPSPQKIVALSYTNTAARQLGERFRRKVKEYGIQERFSFFNGTIHSFCYRMMKQYKEEAFNQIILDDDELEEMSVEIERHFKGKYSRKTILSRLRSNDFDGEDELARQIVAMKEALNVISIKDILLKFIRLIDEDPQFREWIGGRITFVAVDEAQDLSQINFTILDRLVSVIPSLKIFLVGDPKQNIFEFNGGSYRHLEEFLSLYPMHMTKDLCISYRCGKAITDYVNGFRFSDCPNVALEPCPDLSPGEVRLIEARNESEEARKVLDAIIDLEDASSSVVLCNSLPSMESFIQLLREKGIPYKVLGGRRYLKRHVRFLNHILRIIDSDNAYSIRKVAEYAGIDILQDGRRKRSLFFESELGRIISGIRDETKGIGFPVILSLVIDRIMRDPSDKEEIGRDYDELLDLSGLFETTADYLMSFSTDKERFSRFYVKDYEECSVPMENDFVTISTIHSAKGLEWDHVFVMGLCEGVFPNPFFAQGLSPERQVDYFNAEWKKMYVAATRASKSLFLTYPRTILRQGYSFSQIPSRFIASLLETGGHGKNDPKPISATRYTRTDGRIYVR